MRIVHPGLGDVVTVPEGDALVGFRIWRGGPESGELELRSAHQLGRWSPGSPFRATCLPWSLAMPPTHPAPHPRCGCGIHGFFAPDLLERYLAERIRPRALGQDLFYVPGVVVGWGRAVAAPDAWRAELARPLALVRPKGPPAVAAWVSRTAERYGVDVLDAWPDRPKLAHRLAART